MMNSKKIKKESYQRVLLQQNKANNCMHTSIVAQLPLEIGLCYLKIQTQLVVHSQVAILQLSLAAQTITALLLRIATILSYR